MDALVNEGKKKTAREMATDPDVKPLAEHGGDREQGAITWYSHLRGTSRRGPPDNAVTGWAALRAPPAKWMRVIRIDCIADLPRYGSGPRQVSGRRPGNVTPAGKGQGACAGS